MVHSGNVYKGPTADSIVALFYNGLPLPLARIPNSGYLNMDEIQLDSLTIKCNNLPVMNWLNATAHLRTEHWTLVPKQITAANTGEQSITLQSKPEYGLRKNWGFFINNTLTALDTVGEWYCDYASQTIYVYPLNPIGKDGLLVEGSVYPHGIVVTNASYVHVIGFALFGQKYSGIVVDNSNHILISNCDVLYSDVNGISVENNSPSNEIIGNNVRGANMYGIIVNMHNGWNGANGDNTIISENTITQIAVMKRLTKSGIGDHCCAGLGINANGKNLIISKNKLDSIGYIGISNGGGPALIEKNHIQNCCITKDDGAAIYAGFQMDTGSAGIGGTIIRNNIVLSSRHAKDGVDFPYWLSYYKSHGIYIDDYGHDITIENNTAADCAGYGFMLHNSRRIQARGNIAVNNKGAQFALLENPRAGICSDCQMYENNLTNNKMVSFSDTQPSVYTLSYFFATPPDFGKFDSNTYWNPFNRTTVNYHIINQTSDRISRFELPDWQAFTGKDLRTQSASVVWNPWEIKDTISPEMIINGTFNINTAGWAVFPHTSSITWKEDVKMGGGCLEAATPFDGSNQPLIISNIFPLVKDHKYLLRFSVYSEHTDSLIPVVRNANYPWNSVAKLVWYKTKGERRNYEMLFTATETGDSCRIDFNPSNTNNKFWLDNVSLHEVTADTFPASSRIFHYINNSFSDSLINLHSRLKSLDGSPVPSSIILLPFTSEIFYSEFNAPVTDAEIQNVNKSHKLLQAYPNPFNPQLSIYLPVNVTFSNAMKLNVYNIAGKHVSDLTEKIHNGKVIWNAGDLPSGLYIVKLQNNKYSQKIKVTLLR
ncbi:MAG: right-handed parallel beta-helix repeat-containing protein [Fibrobacteres bacterium]|nr:right-handed parallel beta-helix repeat-containing protein [Fibrobacterota bacterium]